MWKVSVWGIPDTEEPQYVGYFTDEESYKRWWESLDLDESWGEIEKLKEFHFIAGEEERPESTE